MNVLRRPGCPFRVTSDDGRTVDEEGRDFAPVRDEKLGQVPYAGEFEFDHAGAEIRILAGGRIREGDRLRVSWYHPVIVHDTQVCCSLSEEKVFAILTDQARRVNELFKPKTFFMSHDEIRVVNWSADERKANRPAGAVLADNAARCVKILRELSPNAQIIVWSDMFDPHHNAVDKYYLVNGSLADSWKGLSADVMIANWNGGKAAASLRHFADRGHAQIIAGYYDSDASNFTHWTTAAQRVPRVTGFLYTTWQSKYDHLEEYGRLMAK